MQKVTSSLPAADCKACVLSTACFRVCAYKYYRSVCAWVWQLCTCFAQFKGVSRVLRSLRPSLPFESKPVSTGLSFRVPKSLWIRFSTSWLRTALGSRLYVSLLQQWGHSCRHRGLHGTSCCFWLGGGDEDNCLHSTNAFAAQQLLVRAKIGTVSVAVSREEMEATIGLAWLFAKGFTHLAKEDKLRDSCLWSLLSGTSLESHVSGKSLLGSKHFGHWHLRKCKSKRLN